MVNVKAPLIRLVYARLLFVDTIEVVKDTAKTVDAYLDSLPIERKESIKAARETILNNLPDGYEEGMQFGMISYYVPLETFADTYNGKPLMYVALANQKNHMSLYLMCEYMDSQRKERFKEKLQAAGKKIDMGKSCVRFKSAQDLPLEVVGNTIAAVTPEDFVAYYKQVRGV